MITVLKASGYKSLSGVCLPTSALNVFSGANSVGKSSLLQVLLLLRQSASNGNISGLELSGELFGAGMAGEVVRLDAQNLTVHISDAESAMDCIFPAPSARERESRKLGLPAPVPCRGFALFAGETERRFAYVSADRIGPRSAHTLVSPSGLAGPVGLRGEYTFSFLQSVDAAGDPLKVEAGWEKVLPLLHAEATRENARLRAPEVAAQRSVVNVTDWIVAWLFPQTSFLATPHKRLALVETSLTNSRLVASMRPENFGFGVSYTLPIIAAALGLASDALLLVENPEAHLSPRAQSQMGMFLAAAAAAGVQVFVETHSDHVVNGMRLAVKRGWLEPDGVLFHHFTRNFDADLTEVETIKCSREGRLSSWPPGFFDQIEADLSELF